MQRVQLANVDNTSGNNNGYADYTGITVQVTAGNSYGFTLTPGFSGGLLGSNSYPEYWRMWIDYNADGDFTDAGEMVYDAGGTSESAVSGSISISSSASGTTRMRISMKYNGAPSSCESFGYGEVEDYTIEITPDVPQPCDTPTGLSVDQTTESSISLSWTAAGSNETQYTLQYRVNGGATWSSQSSAGTSATVSGLSSSTTYDFRVKAICGTDGSAYSATVSGTTDAPAPCNAPSGLAVSNITSQSLQASWNAVGNATQYELEHRPSGGSWTSTVVSSTSATVSGLQPSTTYEVRVSSDCGGTLSSPSGSVMATTLDDNPPVNYCASQGNSTADEWIQSIAVGAFGHSSGNDGGYADFTSQTVSLTIGQNYSVSLEPGFTSGLFGLNTYPEYWKIWIDLNQDGDFTDAGETVFDAGGTSTSTVSGTITVPSGALTGNTRMRVSMKYNGAPSSCESFSYGEVEDYTVAIAASLSSLSAIADVAAEVYLAPNPTLDGQSVLGLAFVKKVSSAQVWIRDVTGKVVQRFEVQGNAGDRKELNIDLSGSPAGVYLVGVQMENGTIDTYRLVKR